MSPNKKPALASPDPLGLGFREREILEVVFRLGRATVAEVRAALPQPPSYSAVRAILGKLERKRFLAAHGDGQRYLYDAVTPREVTVARGLRRIVDLLFEGSTRRTLAALVDSAEDLSADEIRELRALIERHRTEDGP